ncbi:hypothetical protein FF125_08990 [Aureibaculum algae]|uniref:Peptidase M23 n=1 Tax=Aureibaculum algae TaxID=2584122 RepID=A0A5B7TQQ4_9FLAO|nr:hypothetical protein [Aureibaculum algae]QCX38558.1 hypothetical protein FF125_08990 [Aureibaculum algae]
MKKNILSFTIIVLMVGSILTSCGTAVKKDVASAKENAKAAHNDLNQARKDSQIELSSTIQSDWGKFKADSQIALDNSKIEIEKLRGEIVSANEARQQELNKELDKLEQNGNDLKKRLKQKNKTLEKSLTKINEADNILRTDFQKQFVSDMNELQTALKDFFSKNAI